MNKTRAHPKTHKFCAFCNYWMGNAGLNYINNTVGFEFQANVNAKCAKMNNSRLSQYNGTCAHYEPSIEARKLL